MNTFFRICVYFCIGLMIFTLLLNFIATTGAFPFTSEETGKELGNSSTVLEKTTEYTSGGMSWIWIVGISGLVGGIAGFVMHSVVPVGVGLFGGIFWSSFINVHGILSIGGYIPGELLTIFTVATVFIFLAAIIGMLTGSG